jgi:hypothetical protein
MVYIGAITMQWGDMISASIKKDSLSVEKLLLYHHLKL